MIEKLFTHFHFPKNSSKIGFHDSVFLIGSCFSENIATRLSRRKIQTLSNPHGILFDTISIQRCIDDIVHQKEYLTSDLFLHQEIYHSWNHHSDYSSTNINEALEKINNSIIYSKQYLSHANYVIITLGSAFSYFLSSENRFVANCHKYPISHFEKKLMSTADIVASLEEIYRLLRQLNPEMKIILTISPVRHLRDGVIDNNRSKARLIEATHQFILNHSDAYYFPSYEIVVDILRDYRFYDIDFAHPNILATDIVFDYFRSHCIDESIYDMMENFHGTVHSDSTQASLSSYLRASQVYRISYQ